MAIPVALIAAGLSAGAGALNSWWQRRQSQSNTAQTIKGNKELAQYQYEQEQKQLEYMNEYNTPANQKQRLIDAGLNPALMYKGTPQNVQTQLPKYNRPEIEYKNQAMQLPQGLGIPAMSAYQDTRLKTQQESLVEQQVKSTEADTILKLANSNLAKYDLQYRKKIQDMLVQGINLDLKNKAVDWSIKEYQLDVKKVEGELAEMGIFPADPLLMRVAIMRYSNQVKNAKVRNGQRVREATLDEIIAAMPFSERARIFGIEQAKKLSLGLGLGKISGTAAKAIRK